MPSFYQTLYTIPAGGTLTVNIWMKQSDTGLSVIPKAMIIDAGQDPMLSSTYSALSTFTLTDNTDWQTDTLTWTNSDNVPLPVIIRAVYTHSAVATVYFYYEIPSTGGGIVGAGGMHGGFP
jgi:hypothetical protein